MLKRILVHLKDGSPREMLSVVAVSLVLLALCTAALMGLQSFTDVGTVTIIYLIAVLFAATRGGILSAIVTAVAAVGAAVFFFYSPIYDFRVHSPIHLIDLVLFIIVAVVTGKLATDVQQAKVREHADALREALIGSVSHELRSPLASIIGTASILTEAPEISGNPSLSPLVEGLRQEAERLNDDIQDLLDATRINSDGVQPHLQWVDPADIVNAALERKRRQLAAHNLEIDIADQIALVRVDPMLIEKALGHIIENAVKYSPAGSLIQVSAVPSQDAVKLSVKDQGIGLEREELAKIWDRFYRSPRLQDSISGSGLGLWIARAFVMASKGRVEVHSPGLHQGTIFSIYLPAPSTGTPQGDSD
jgi:K+-sensing histidine kinase KdpD